jgi:DNA-binding Xre family transcriptional regulator
MLTMPVHWKVKALLDKHGISVYRLWQESGLAQATVYRLARGDTGSLNADTINGLMQALRRLTGEQIEIADIIEYQDPEEP